MDRSLLRNSSFRQLLVGQSFNLLANQMLVVAVAWQVYDLTNSALSLGLIGLVQFLPQLLLALPAGHVADRYDRRHVVAICQVIQGSVAVVLSVGSYAHWLNSELIYVSALLIGAARTFQLPAMQALLPSLVKKDVLPKAIAMYSMVRNTFVIAGPALGGVIYLLGAGSVYATCAAFHLVTCIMIMGVRMPFSAPHREPTTLKSVLAGVMYIRGNPVMLGAISLDLFAVLLGGVTALLPIYARDILETGPWGLGLLRGAPSIGALLTAVVLVQMPIKRRAGLTMFTGVAVFGLASIVFALSRSFALSMSALVVLGAADMVSVVIRSSLIQLETPDQMRGRVNAVSTMFIGASNQLGEFQSGMVAALIGAVSAAVVGGVGSLLVVALWMRLFPSLVRRDALVAAPIKGA